MSRRGNWSRLRIRDRMRTHGTSDAREELRAVNAMLASSVPGRWPPSRRRPPSKAELRAQAAAAFVAWRKQHASEPLAPRVQGDRGATPGDVAPPWE
jgi:hypothetical protein